MKNLKLFVMSVVAMFIAVVSVRATTIAELSGTTFEKTQDENGVWTIKLLDTTNENLEIGTDEVVVLDLNGQRLDNTTTSGRFIVDMPTITIAEGGTLTIISSGTGFAMITRTHNCEGSQLKQAIIDNRGVLNLEAGYISPQVAASYGIRNLEGAVLNVSGNANIAIVSENTYGLWNDGIAHINGGRFDQGVNANYPAVVNNQGAEMNITDGLFRDTTGKKLQTVVPVGESKLTITGGQFDRQDPNNNFASEPQDMSNYMPEGYSVDQYGKITETIYTVEVEESEYGKVAVDLTKAKAGETVTVTVTPDEGYEVSKVFVNGTEIKANEDGTYSFAIPASDVKVSAEFEKVQINNPEAGGHETETGIVVEDNKGTKEVTLTTEANDVLKESLTKTTDKELQEFLASNNVTIHLESNKVAKENVATEVVEKFESVVKGATVAEYFDLDIIVTADGKEVHYLKELSKPITLTVDLPTTLPEVAKGYTRTYYILREHDGVYEKLNATLTKDGKLSFATDKFSKYAIAYEDVKNPDTLDSIVSIVTLAISSIGTAGYSIKKFIRK